MLADPDHDTAQQDRSNAETPIRLPTPRAHIERALARKPSAQLAAKPSESGKTVVRTVTQVQDTLEDLSNTSACLANENWRCLDTARDDAAALFASFEKCADKAEIVRCARQILDPGVEPQQPMEALLQPEQHRLPSFEDLQHRCETTSLLPNAGPFYIKARVAWIFWRTRELGHMTSRPTPSWTPGQRGHQGTRVRPNWAQTSASLALPPNCSSASVPHRRGRNLTPSAR